MAKSAPTLKYTSHFLYLRWVVHEIPTSNVCAILFQVLKAQGTAARYYSVRAVGRKLSHSEPGSRHEPNPLNSAVRKESDQ